MTLQYQNESPYPGKPAEESGGSDNSSAACPHHSQLAERVKDLTHSICPECARKYYPNLDLYDD
ncbi:MAG: hypothetical protein ACQETC_00355 [Thermodesulfobacteriota bacterium]